jgi:hypothetical protein
MPDRKIRVLIAKPRRDVSIRSGSVLGRMRDGDGVCAERGAR